MAIYYRDNGTNYNDDITELLEISDIQQQMMQAKSYKHFNDCKLEIVKDMVSYDPILFEPLIGFIKNDNNEIFDWHMWIKRDKTLLYIS